MIVKSNPSYSVQIKMAGDIQLARAALQNLFYPPNEGFCVTLQPASFLYTAGIEEGFIVGLENYPRFPKTFDEILKKSEEIAQNLIESCFQWSAMIVTPRNTYWLTTRPEDQPKEKA